MSDSILLAGHIVKDITTDGWRPGGGVLYAAAQCLRLGLQVRVLTACADDLEPQSLLPDVDWLVVPSETTTTFENRYEDGARSQRILATGRTLTLQDMPRGWLKTPLMLLTPVFQEIEVAFPRALSAGNSLVGVAAQGWLRRLEGDRVRQVEFDEAPAWLGGHVVFVSDEDVSDADAVPAWTSQVPIVVLTLGSRGCSVWHGDIRHDLSPAAVAEVDPTGAGDVFAAAFIVRYAECGDALESARFASAAAALSIRGEGVSAVSDRSEIEALLQRGEVKVA
jgi:sugar/nucleoside kinase (ribokinase family)